METQDFKDQVRQGRGFFPSAPLHTPEAVGDAAIAGANCLFSKFGQIRSWRGFSPLNSRGAKLLHVVGGQLAGNKTGNVWQQHGEAVFLIGSGNTFLDDFFNSIGVASSQLQVRIGGQTYQAGLPKPPAPTLEIARDSIGQPIGGRVTGLTSARITRLRTATGAESPASDTSALVSPTGGRLRLSFPQALTSSQGQDRWGVYLTRQGFGGEGPHTFFKEVEENEIAPPSMLAVASAPGNGINFLFGGTTAVALNSRYAMVVIRDATGTITPSYVGSSYSATPGFASSLRVQKPVGAQSPHFLMVMVSFLSQHLLTPDANNKGAVTISAVNGVWTAFPPLNPQAQNIQIIIEQDSATTFRWKLSTDISFGAPIALSTGATALFGTGLSIIWTGTSSPEGVGNKFTITPFSLIPPEGWSNITRTGNQNNLIGMGIFGWQKDTGMPDFADWTASSPTLMSAIAVAFKDVSLTVPGPNPIDAFQVGSSASPQTTHQIAAVASPAANRLVTFWFSGDDPFQDFTPTAPLTAVTNSKFLTPRFVDLDFSDDDLNENILAPKDFEGPPAGTHGFPIGPITVVAGALGGTALAPSRPNQPEQYDLTQVTYLNPPEPIVRCEIRPHDGLVFIWTRNSFQTVIYTDEEISPVRAQAIWGNTGIASPSGACLSQNGAYAATAKSGFARFLGNQQPDTGYADPVNDYVKDWNPEDVAMGYDGILDGIAHCRGREILLFLETLGIWSPPLRIDLYDMPGDPDLQPRIVSCATIDSRLHFAVQTGEDAAEAYEIFVFDEGMGGEWFLRGVARHGDAPGLTKTLSHLRLIADFTADQLLGYFNFVGMNRRQGTETLVMDNPDAPGYCVGRAALPEYWTSKGRFRLEWTITAPQLAERWVAFTENIYLARHGSPVPPLPGPNPPLPTTDYDTDSLFAWRVDAGGVLSWYLGGAPTAHASVQVGDVIRIEWNASGAAIGTLLRNGAPVGSPFNFGTPGGGWPKWLGFKVGLGSGGTLSLGRLSFAPGGQSGRLKLWKNFAAERGGEPVFDKSYAADGDKTYDWEKPNLTQIVSYNVEVGGNSSDQDVSVVYLEGYTSDVRQPLLTQ